MDRKLGKAFEELVARAGDPGTGQLITSSAANAPAVRSTTAAGGAKKRALGSKKKSGVSIERTKKHAKTASRVARPTDRKKSSHRAGSSPRKG